MGNVGESSRGYRLTSAGARAVPFTIRDDDANAIRGIAFGCAVSALFWAGLGALVRATWG
jgi:hypothetical protein